MTSKLQYNEQPVWLYSCRSQGLSVLTLVPQRHLLRIDKEEAKSTHFYYAFTINICMISTFFLI